MKMRDLWNALGLYEKAMLVIPLVVMTMMLLLSLAINALGPIEITIRPIPAAAEVGEG